MNYGSHMKNTTLKTNDISNIVHLYCFHSYNTCMAKKSQILQYLAPISPTQRQNKPNQT
jgi:hypothetical protein